MTAAANLRRPPTMTARPPSHDLTEEELAGRRNFKKHKVLPHPSRQRDTARTSLSDVRSTPTRHAFSLGNATSHTRQTSQSPSSPTLKHQSRRIRSGPAMPPTPPTHSRTSSSSHSIQLHSPIDVETPSQSLESVPTRPERPTTPQNQQSPPTPDVTPPQPASRPKALRPVFGDRSVSKATTSESRTESFRTAREEFYSSEDDCKSTVRPSLPSPRTSQTTVRQISQTRTKKSQPAGVGLGLDFDPKSDDSLTPRTRGEFIKFDAGWESSNDVEKEWDDNLGRHVMVRKTRKAPETPHTPRLSGHENEVFDDYLVSPTNATQALRAVPLHDRMTTHPVPKETPDRKTTNAKAATSESSTTQDHRRFSGMSAKSGVSTVVEAILVDTPSPPRRQQTLRHMRKRGTLRDSLSDLSPNSSTPSSTVRLEDTAFRQPAGQSSDTRRESHTSATTYSSMSSNKARREIWKSGGIPVVIVPDRRSSSKSSQTPSLRSTSSRRTKRSLSVNSVQRINGTKGHDLTPLFDRPSRRRRTMSESDGSDQRTIDYPPAIPTRSSSLSAPTSRNTSRAGSMTAESLRAHNAVQQRLAQESKRASLDLKSTPSFHSAHEDYMHVRPSVHKPEVDLYSGKRLSHQNTPFSVASLDTNGSFGTAAEVSEALAVSIYPHQNSSLLMVNHSTKPNDDADASEDKTAEEKDEVLRVAGALPERPKIVTTSPEGSVPVTPPQTQLALDQVDSPLKNPRVPPVPPTLPAIQFIPATPSGLTPFHERQEMRGNYFETIEDERPPQRNMSLVRRALLQRRRHSESYPPKTARPGFLSRTLSLSRSNRRDAVTEPSARESPYPNIDDPPVEGNKLHPFWRPAYVDDDDDYVRDVDDEDYYYPPVDNRPRPQRSLSARMKRTFAILPHRDQDGYRSWSGEGGLDRRIIRRTPSGNLRVVQRRKSAESLPRESDRPYTSDGTSSSRLMWPTRGRPKDDTPSTPRRRFSVSHTIEELQGLPRRLSERRRERRTQELRQKISGPREVRDGVGDVVRSGSQRSHVQGTTS